MDVAGRKFKSSEVWVSRGAGKYSDEIRIWDIQYKPCYTYRGQEDGDVDFYHEPLCRHRDRMIKMSVAMFKALFGFTPKKGTRQSYEFTSCLRPIKKDLDECGH